MNAIKLYFTAAFSFLLILSSFATNDTIVNTLKVQGTWKLTRIESINVYDFNNDNTPSFNLLNETNCYRNDNIIFRANQTMEVSATNYATIKATPKVDDGVQNIAKKRAYTYNVQCINNELSLKANWAIDGNNLVIIDRNGSNEIFPIVNNQFAFISDNALVIENTEDGSIMIEEDLRFVYTKE